MSYSKTINYNIGSSGDAANTTNTQCDQIRLTAGAGSMTIDTAHALAGTKSLHEVGTSTSGLVCAEDDDLGGLSTFTFDKTFYLAAMPSAETTIMRLLDSSDGTLCSLGFNGSGIFVGRNAAGSSTGLPVGPPSGSRPVVGNTVRAVLDAVAGTSGSLRLRVFINGSGTAAYDSGVLTSNNGAGQFAHLRRGPKAATGTATSEFYSQSLTLTGTSPISANAGPDQTGVEPYSTVTLDGTGSDGATTYAWTQTAGTTVTLTGASTASPTFTAPALINGGTLTFQLTVDGGATDTVDIAVVPHTVWQRDAGGVLHPVRITQAA